MLPLRKIQNAEMLPLRKIQNAEMLPLRKFQNATDHWPLHTDYRTASAT